MDFKEWLRSNRINEVGKFYDSHYENLDNVVGKHFWICDYRLNKDKDNKPIRAITPKLVQVFSNDILPASKRVYYSPIHFKEIKNGKVLSAVIGPYDGTGYKTYPGVSVNIFDHKEECIKFFINQCEKAVEEYKVELERRTAEINRRIEEIQKLKAKYECTEV